MKTIILTKGKVALVDDDVYEFLSQWKWHFTVAGYAARRDEKSNKAFLMHRVIMNTPTKMECDHINRDRCDNRKENLRNCTSSQNKMNRPAQLNNTTGAKGVHIYNRKFRAKIQVDHKQIHLGYFNTLQQAARAYDAAAEKYHGTFANKNQKEN